MRRIPFPFLLSLAAAPLQAQDLGPARLQSAFAPFRAHAVTVDVDLDGDEDLLWCESLGSTVLWMENDGAGRFLGVRWVGAADAPSDGVGTAAVPFDVDADGDLDVVVARFGLFSDDGLGWHENLGAERFAPYATLGYAVPSASVLRVRDVDGDGDDDLLFSIEGSGPAWIEFGGGALGALGALRTVRSWPFALFELEAADLDADGVVDVVWTESFGAGTRWCRGLGGGVFDAPVELSPFGASAAGLRVADADADGDLDVVVATRAPSEVIVVEALGAGTFAAPVVAAASAADFVGLDLVDLDGDGDLDVVTATLDTALAEARENLGALQLGPASPSQLSDVVGPGASVGSADFDGDGLLDPWIAGGTFHWIPGGGSAALGDPFRPGTRVLPDIRAEAGDVDGDGVFELVTADAGSLHVFEGPGDGLAPVQSIPLGFPVTDAPRIVDLDGDGDLDVVVGGGSLAAGAARVVWLENDGLLGPPALVWTGPAAGGATVRTGDADGDGLVDLFVARPDSGGSGLLAGGWLLQGPAGTFVESQQTVLLPDATFEAADLDGDALSDVVVLDDGSAPPGVVWFASEGAGTVGAGLTLFSIDVGTSQAPFTAGDLDADGDDDVVYFDAALGEVVLLMSEGSGAFGSPTVVGPVTGAPRVVLGDVDGDGDDDVIAHDDATIHVHLNDGGGSFSAPVSLPNDFGSGAVFVADFDGDTDGDLVQLGARGVVLRSSGARLGRAACLSETSGSNGLRPRLTATGSTAPGAGDLEIVCDRLPENQFGLLLVGSEPDKAPLVGGIGTLCLGGSIGRFTGPGEIQSSGAFGRIALAVDPRHLPTPSGFESVSAGTTRWFQYWTRDLDAQGAATSNFSSSIELDFD